MDRTRAELGRPARWHASRAALAAAAAAGLALATTASARPALASSPTVAAMVVATASDATTQTPAAPPAAAPPASPVATPSGPPLRELSLDDALAMARRTNRNLTAEQAHLAQARINVDQAWTVLFPTLSAQGKFSHNNRSVELAIPNFPAITVQRLNQLDGVVSFSVPLVVPAAYSALRAVNLTERASEENYSSAVDNVLFTVAETFHAAALSDEVLVARHSNIDVARATLADARARFDAGTVTKVDVDRAQIAVLQAEQAERDAVLARDQDYRALATLIQAPGPFRVRPVPTPASPAAAPPASDPDAFVTAALRLRPEFLGLEASVEAARAEQRSHAWQWSPSLSAFGNARAFNYQNFAGDHYAWVLGAQLDWLLYDGGVRDAQRRLASAVADEVGARSQALRDTIRDDLENGRRAIATKSQAQSTAERSVDLAKEALELVRVQYEAGASTQVDLLQAQDKLVAAQDAVARAHYEIAIADLTFRRAAGTLLGR